MGEGIKVSQLGYDAGDSGDQYLLFSSGWPLLKIAYTGTVTLDTSKDNVIFNHNLTYPPFFIMFNYTTGKSFMQGPRFRIADPRFYVTTSILGITGAGDGSLAPQNYRWYICRLPLDQPFTAPVYSLSNPAKGDRNQGIGLKVAKEGADINSTDLRDYTIHSGTRSPMVHSVTAGLMPQVGSSDYELTWINNLGYDPMYFSFSRSDFFANDVGKWYGPVNLADLSSIHPGVQNLTAFSSLPLNYASIVVFKDPFLPSQTQRISI